ncbi:MULTISPECIES: ABC transporter permease [unclassified Pedobacter]|uniref:ABC transporter permease n=1 Tax=unclassified Pedobacter TaxID=2628915 RepID=UPI0014245997|nr:MULTISPECIES: ABC transporter permease [unclassified Pedobacter]NII81338.1 lipopolysaccharide transport system permease protein [Pedobacter sp. SG908]NMN35344.1 lipopolysaccharide transport system permease protein [Pedobacter sp. SG918]
MHNEEHTWTIEAKASLFDLKLNEIWAYRDLLWLLVRRDFVSFYKQTILGPLWFFIQPLFTTIIFTFIFGNLAGISTDGLPKPLFYLAGITAWNYFADCLTKTSTVFRDNAAIFGKVYFPRLIMPLSIVVSNLVRFGVQMILFLIMFIYYYLADASFQPSWAITLVPIVVILMALLGLGTGMIISAMTTKYRDLAFLVGFGVQLLMYATTVIYPLSTAIEKYPKYAWIIKYNPMTPIIETFRYGFLGEGSFSWSSLGYATGITTALLFFGIVIFNKVERNFVDTV